MELETSSEYKEKGNQLFQLSKYVEALTCYTKGLQLCDKEDSKEERTKFYKNRAACHLKLNNYEQAVNDATSALVLSPVDTKALYRRAQAYEKMGQIQKSFEDAQNLIRIDPTNKAAQEMCRKLNIIVSQKVTKLARTDEKISQMFDLLLNNKEGNATILEAANNLIVISREEAGAKKIYDEEGAKKLKELMTERTDDQTCLAALRTINNLCKNNKQRAIGVIQELTLETLTGFLKSNNEELCTAIHTILQTYVNILVKDVKEDRWKHIKLFDDETNELLKPLLMCILQLLTSKSISGLGRDAVLNLITKSLPFKNGIGKAMTFISNGGLNKLLFIACQIEELGRLPITKKTRMNASIALNMLWEEMIGEKNFNYFKELCSKFIGERFGHNSMEANMESVVALTALLQGPFEVGDYLLGQDGVQQVIVAMTASKDVQHQIIAAEAIVYSASKQKTCTGMLQHSIPLLKTLFTSSNDAVKVRALVGLCKFASFGGTDASIQEMSEGSMSTLAQCTINILLSHGKDYDIRKWAADGLAFLSLDAEVKEIITDNPQVLRSLIDLAQMEDKSMLYGISCVFVNLTNSYDVQKPPDQLVELAKYAKQHVPEEHPMDDQKFVEERIKKLIDEGIVIGLVALSNIAETEGSRELLSRVFLSLVVKDENRGIVVQQGGAKVLLNLANEGNLIGKTLAAQSLAKIAITMNPEVAFPGQRCLELVRPLISLLHIERSGLQNYEALMALTNLASLGENFRKRIVKEKGISSIENYMFEDHDMIKRAATECMCNLALSNEVLETFLQDNDRIKLFTLYAGEFEDFELCRAAAGILAFSSRHVKVCGRIMEVKAWAEILQNLCVSDNKDLQLRGLHILYNMIDSNKEIASVVVSTNLLEVMLALSMAKADEGREEIKGKATEALNRASQWGIIKKNATNSV